MKKNLIFLAEKLGLLGCIILMMTVFGHLLHMELDRKWHDAFHHYFYVWFSFACVLFLLFAAFYVAHLIAARDYKIKKH